MTSPNTMSRPRPSSPNSVARSREPNPLDELRRDEERAGPPTLDKNHLRRCLYVDTPSVAVILRTLATKELRRQDSNLNYLNQNQRCCRLHHDGLINT